MLQGCTVVPAGPPARSTLLTPQWALPTLPAAAVLPRGTGHIGFKPYGCTLSLKLTFYFIIQYKVEEFLGISYGVSISTVTARLFSRGYYPFNPLR